MARSLRCPKCQKVLAALILVENDLKTITLYCPEDDARSLAMTTAEEAFENLCRNFRPVVKSS
jgi:uncharacterized radical SAM superfamily Fe-S cluster-containing enzyme